jgi:DDE superfamily endonuclease
VNKKTKGIICTEYTSGKKHDFKLFKESPLAFKQDTKVLTDTGYQGIKKIHKNSEHPKKRSKHRPLSQEEKIENRKIARERVTNENVISLLKRFKIISDRYRNRRKRFGLRFNLISGIHNYEL